MQPAIVSSESWGPGLVDSPMSRLTRAALRPMQALMAEPSLLFLIALSAMLLHHPDVPSYEIDRIALLLLLAAVGGRLVLQRRPANVFTRASWPMLGLTLLALGGALRQPFDPEVWSVLASKLLVPFVLFHLAQIVFTEEREFRRFEMYAVLVLAYLSFTAVAFLLGAKSLIFPRFILDESVGSYVDRARGPFLQAVANGVSLNLLGILALHAYRRGRFRGAKILLLLASVPLGIVATMTRAVWLSFAATVVLLLWQCRNRRVRSASIILAIIASAAFAAFVSSSQFGDSLSDRFEERGPVDFRQAVYAGSWQMFLDRPITGWGFHQMPLELPRYVSGYTARTMYPHNTYLELLVEHGLVGFGLYIWLMWELWRLGRGAIPPGERKGFLDCGFHSLWPILLAVYWVNAAVVVMTYQFVNGLLFAIAGMLAAQRRRAEALTQC
jgi:putative inorganic carbon (hco3(-)) transporter